MEKSLLQKSMELSLFGLFISLMSSCAWGYSQSDIASAFHLDATATVDEVLTITVSGQEPLFKDSLTKDNVLLVRKSDVKAKGASQFAVADLVSAKINDFSFNRIDEKTLAITLSQYNPTTYFVLVDKAGMKNDTLAIAQINLSYLGESFDAPYSFLLDASSIYPGQADPTFMLHYAGTEAVNSALISFGQGFDGLSLTGFQDEGGSIEIHGKGAVKDSPYGTITFGAGSFKGVSEDLVFYQKINQSPAILDVSSLSFDGSALNFDILSQKGSFLSSLGESNASLDKALDKVSLQSIQYKDEGKINVKISIVDSSLTDIGSVLDYLKGQSLTLIDAFDDGKCSVSVSLSAYRPFILIRPFLNSEAHTLQMDVTIRHAGKVDSWTKEDLSFESPSLLLDGDSPKATLSSVESTSTGFKASFDLKNANVSHVYGKMKFLGDKLKTLWGESFLTEVCFDTDDLSRISFDSASLTSFADSSLKATISKDSIESCNIIGSFYEQLGGKIEDYGLSGGFASLLYLLNYLGACENQTDVFSMNFRSYENGLRFAYEDRLSRLAYYGDVLESSGGNAFGVDETSFSQNESKWREFATSIETLRHAERKFVDDYREALFQSISGEDDLPIRLYLAKDSDGNTVSVLPDPSSDSKSIDGLEILDMYTVKVPASYFEILTSKYHSSDDLDEYFLPALSDCLNLYISRFPHDNISGKDLFGAMLGHIASFLYTSDEIAPVHEALISFSSGLADSEASPSALNNLFEMAEGYYNFQSEASDAFLTFRANAKIDLVRLSASSLFLCRLAGADPDIDAIASSFLSAQNFLLSHDHLQALGSNQDYSYVSQSPINGHLLHGKLSASYKGEGNACLLQASYQVEEDGNEVPYLNSGSLYSAEELGCLYQRYLYLHSSAEAEYPSFTEYLIGKGLLNVKALEANGEQNKVLPVLVSYAGPGEASEGYRPVHDIAKGSGEDFTVGKAYLYEGKGDKGESDASCWSSISLNGKLLSLQNLAPFAENLEVLSRYDEVEALSIFDEHHAFALYSDGLYFVAFTKEA